MKRFADIFTKKNIAIALILGAIAAAAWIFGAKLLFLRRDGEDGNTGGATFTRPLERVSSLDPIKAQSVYAARAVLLYAETPLTVDYKARPYRLGPGLCELPQVSADGLEYTLKMVEDAPLGASDVKRALERIRDPNEVSPGGWTMENVDAIKLQDERTLVIRLKKRSHVFPWMLSMAYTAVLDKDGNGTGPYKLAVWRKNHEMSFVRNHSWRGWKNNDCPFERINYLTIDEAPTQWLMFLKGELDFLGEVSRDNWDAVVDGEGNLDKRLAEKGIRMAVSPSLDIRYIGFNMRDSVLGNNVALRRALTCAFDFQAWRNFYNGRIDFADGPVPVDLAGHLDEAPPYTFDIERAKALLDEAGYPGGIDPATGRRLVLSLSIGRPTQDSREAGELLASFFARIGVKLELKFHTWEAFLDAVNNGRCQMYMMGWVGDYPDAENFLQLFITKNSSPGSNHSCYSNPLYDAEYELAMEATSEEERILHWKNCQRILREDCPWIFTHFPKSYSLLQPTVGNYVPSAFPYGDERFYRANKANVGENAK